LHGTLKQYYLKPEAPRNLKLPQRTVLPSPGHYDTSNNYSLGLAHLSRNFVQKFLNPDPEPWIWILNQSPLKHERLIPEPLFTPQSNVIKIRL